MSPPPGHPPPPREERDEPVDQAGAAGRASDSDGDRASDSDSDHASDSDLDNDDVEELNEQVDLDDLEDLADTPVENAPIPAGITTLEAGAAADEPIPMLTEVVQVPRYDSEDLPESFAEVDWGDLSQRVRENVLERLLRRSDALLDAQLQNTLTPVLERAAETIAHELHDALNRMIRDIVARAVTEELTRLHAEIAKRNRSSRST